MQENSFFPSAVNNENPVPSPKFFNLRELILQIILLLISLYGIIHFNFSAKSAQDQGDILFTAELLFFTIVALVLFFFPRLTFQIRFTTLLVLCTLQATTLLLYYGWGLIALSFLLFFALVCTISSSKRSAIIGAAVSAISVVIWVVLALTGKVPSENQPSKANLLLEASMAFVILPTGIVFLQAKLNQLLGRITQFKYAWSIPGKYPDQTVETTPDRSLTEKSQEPISPALKKAANRPLDQNPSSELLHILSSERDAPKAIQQICELLKHTLNLYYAAVFQLDTAREYAVLQYGTGEEGLQMLNASYRLSVGGFSLVGKAIQSEETITSLMNENDPSRFENPFLPESRCETALPLILDGMACGALDIHTTLCEELKEDQFLLLQQAAYALSICMDRCLAGKPVSLQRPPKPASSAWTTGGTAREFESEYRNPSIEAESKKSILEIPLVYHHERIGNLTLETNGKELTKEENVFIRNATEQTLGIIENSCRIERINRQAELEHTVFEISARLHATNDSRQMLQIALEEISKNLDVSKAQIVLNVPESPQTTSELDTNTRSLAPKPTTGPLVER